ncbi:hypothetical protein GBAR_LOCUS25772 [Geodia barretti]|uniref:Formiminotransferase C-terminal subdomain domain-containing protein n=1 Tax=Geodia barretti TaxID=519541 RepID=A0AA35TF48_GEOBA|nr:hypothetical protein GBAR_LOCUS25772 [Geodia barretti]
MRDSGIRKTEGSEGHWVYLDDQDLAQVSINICDFQTTPLHVSLIQERDCSDGGRQKVRLAVERLGLASLGEFKPEEKIIEYRVGSCKDGPLLFFISQSVLSSLPPGHRQVEVLPAS